MKFEIAKHAFGLIARNIGMAVRIVVLPWILIRMLNYVLLFLLFITGLGQAETIPGSGVFFGMESFPFCGGFRGDCLDNDRLEPIYSVGRSDRYKLAAMELGAG